MGTSRSAPPSPKWTQVKTAVTTALNSGPVTPPVAHDLISQFVQQMASSTNHEGFGAPIKFISPAKADQQLQAIVISYPASSRASSTTSGPGENTRGSGGRASSKSSASRKTSGQRGSRSRAISGIGIRSTAQRVASFLSDVRQVGLVQALAERGFSDLENLPPERLAIAIADVLQENSSYIIEIELREALSQVFEKICVKQDDLANLEIALDNAASDIGSVLTQLFECYIIERFKTNHGEHLAKEHGYEAADKIVNAARDFVAAELAFEETTRHDLTSVDWGGREGEGIVNAILERTVAVYIDTEGSR
ncbi:hypothetical protein [Prosthecobacter fusiformis]|uniref:hypothetical protein n=1 Tax=Prosthecobacter fusiformis TaxID=48464 RepID=UPI00105E9626|nr:hypothetical protein [Prosthecobacter fusiformis]